MVAKVREWRHVYGRMGRPGGPYHLIDSQGSWKGWKGVLVPNSLYYHLVMTTIAMENPKNKWRFLAGKIIYLFLWAIYTMAMLNNQRVIFETYWYSFKMRYEVLTSTNGKLLATKVKSPHRSGSQGQRTGQLGHEFCCQGYSNRFWITEKWSPEAETSEHVMSIFPGFYPHFIFHRCQEKNNL